jgi:hypothetical protein
MTVSTRPRQIYTNRPLSLGSGCNSLLFDEVVLIRDIPSFLARERELLCRVGRYTLSMIIRNSVVL